LAKALIMRTVDLPREKKLERVAHRHGLCFYVDGYSLCHTCGEEESREATDEEITLWQKVCPELSPWDPRKDIPDLPATWDEVRASWTLRAGPFTVNSQDLAVILKHGSGRFEPETGRDSLFNGFFGCFDNKPVYVSRSIPVGFYYEGPRIPEIHWRPAPGGKRMAEPELSFDVESQVLENLLPFDA
jgi:hypothetical protein